MQGRALLCCRVVVPPTSISIGRWCPLHGAHSRSRVPLWEILSGWLIATAVVITLTLIIGAPARTPNMNNIYFVPAGCMYMESRAPSATHNRPIPSPLIPPFSSIPQPTIQRPTPKKGKHDEKHDHVCGIGYHRLAVGRYMCFSSINSASEGNLKNGCNMILPLSATSTRRSGCDTSVILAVLAAASGSREEYDTVAFTTNCRR